MSNASGKVFRDQFVVGAVSVQIASRRRQDVAFGPSLARFRAPAERCDIEIDVDWLPAILHTQRRCLFDSGSVWQLFDSGDCFEFEFSSPSFGGNPYKRFVIDKAFRSATLQMNKEAFRDRPADPLDYPLDELLIMHRLTQERAIELHGCGIVRANGAGNLFVGHSGAGKSTTTRLWIEREEVEILSDDRIIVRPDPQSVGGMRMYGTPWHGEAMFASPNSARLERIVILLHGHGNVLTRLSRSEAVAELFARSFVPFHCHEYVEAGLNFLEELVKAVPVYLYAFEPDQRAVDKILNLHE